MFTKFCISITIIIPTLNESENIQRFLSHLQQYDCDKINEIIVADGGSNDETIALALKEKAVVSSVPVKARAAQMNYAAQTAKGSTLYCVHAKGAHLFPNLTDFNKAVALSGIPKKSQCSGNQHLTPGNTQLLKTSLTYREEIHLHLLHTYELRE